MTITLVLIILTWFFTGLLMNVLESVILYFKPNAKKYAKLASVLLTSFFIFMVYFNFSLTLDVDQTSVFNSGQEEASNSSSNKGGASSSNPFGIKIVSNIIGASPEFDLRNISDVLLLTAIGKAGLGAMSSVSTPRAKALVGTTTILSLGTVGAGYKFMNQARNNLRALDQSQSNSQGDVAPSPTNENFTTNSPLENLSSSESLVWALFCIKVLIITVLFLIIIIFILNWTLNKLNLLKDNKEYPHYFNFLSKENNDFVLNKALLLSRDSGRLTVKLLILLVFFNLISSIYLINDVMSFISLLDF